MKDIVSIEIRDSQDVLFGYLKKNITFEKAIAIVNKRNWTVWKNGFPYTLCIKF